MNENQRLKDLPQELKLNALFCGWKLTENGKVPFDLVTDKLARSNDPKTFVGYGTLLHYCHKYLTDDTKTSGIGLGIFKGFSAVDIDHCVNNGELSDMAKEIINFCNSYTEYSPSGSGIRIIFKTNTNLDKNIYYIKNSSLGLEIYISDNTNKFVTLTGNKISGDNINNVDILPILDKYMKKPENHIVDTEVSDVKYDGKVDLEKIFERDLKFKELWYNKAPGSGSNESELDLALCNKLAYYYRCDKNRINNAFVSSPYFNSKDDKHKEKWFTTHYAVNTVNMAVSYTYSQLPPLYEPIKTESEKPVVLRENYGLNDTGNAERFIDKYSSDIRYNFDLKQWMIWNGKCWEVDTVEKVRTFIDEMVDEMKEEALEIQDMPVRALALKNVEKVYNNAGRESLLKEARHFVPITNSELDNDEYLFAFENGTLDLRTGELRESKREDKISKLAGCEIDTEHKPTLFLKMLHDMWPNEPENIEFLQRWFGYCMTNDAREQKMLFVQSDGNSGKSMLFDVVNNIMGGYGITADSDLITDLAFKSSNSEQIARLQNKRFVYIDEVEENAKLKEKLVKDLTSGISKMVGRFLYANSVEFEFKGKLNVTTNYTPNIKGFDKGVWRRIILLKTTLDVTGRENKNLKEELKAEYPQIAGWIYEGLKKYLSDNDLKIPQTVLDNIEEYKKANDNLQDWINEYCEVDDEYFEQATTLFDSFNLYATKYNIFRPTMTRFGRDMTERKGFKKKLYNGKTVYFGIRLKKDYQDIKKKATFDTIKVDGNI